jgi:hypothetical protein
MVRLKKYKHLAIELQKEPPKIVTPPEFPELPCLVAAYAIRNSGKSTAIQSNLRKYKAANLCHRVFIVTPSWLSNSFLFEGLVADEDVFEPTQASLDEIVRRTEEEAKEWREYEENRAIWKEYKRQERLVIAGKLPEVDPELLSGVVDINLFLLDKYPDYKYPGCQRPQIWCVIDDCQDSPVMTTSSKAKNSLSALAIRNRHVGGHRFGLNLVIAMQSYKKQTGALNKAIRNNVTAMMLWNFRDVKLMEDIYSDIGRDVTKAQFFNAFAIATGGDKHNYLLLEFSPGVRMRQNFDTIIDLASLPKTLPNLEGEGEEAEIFSDDE